jgi:hypothetical protein
MQVAKVMMGLPAGIYRNASVAEHGALKKLANRFSTVRPDFIQKLGTEVSTTHTTSSVYVGQASLYRAL